VARCRRLQRKLESSRAETDANSGTIFWFPGSAWEPTVCEALPRGSLRRGCRSGTRGGASTASRAQAEPGNEIT